MANMSIDSTTGRYTYTASVSGNFNLHLEKDFECPVQILVKTAGTNYAPAHCFSGKAKVVDADFTGEVFGKDVKIECMEVAPSGATAPTIVITEA